MDRQLQFVLREVPEHGDVLIQRVVKEEHVLSDKAHDVVEAVGVDLPQFLPVNGDRALIPVVGPHEKVQQRGLPRPGAAHQGVLLPGLQTHGQVPQYRLARLVSEGDVFQGNGILQHRRDRVPGAARVLLRDLRQLLHQPGGGPAVGQALGQDIDRIQHITGQIDKNDDRTGGDIPPDGEIRAQEKDAHLHDQSAQAGGLPDERLAPAAAVLDVLQRLVGAVEALSGLLFRLEALDNGKAAEQVLDLRHKAFVLVADSLLPFCQSAACHRHRRYGQQSQQNVRCRQQRAVPDHHHKGSRACQHVGRHLKRFFQIVAFDGCHIVGQGG